MIKIKKFIPKKIKNKLKKIFFNIKVFPKQLKYYCEINIKHVFFKNRLNQCKKEIKIYDIFIFFNELDLLEIRLNILNNYVDYFVIIEATKTFTGKDKELFFEENKDRFKKFSDKIIHFVVDDMPENKTELKDALKNKNLSDLQKQIITDTCSSDNIPADQDYWLREFYQKECMKKPLQNLNDNDFCFISDLDEIWNPKVKIDYSKDCIYKLKQKMYVYYLNNRSSENWTGTFAAKYKNIKNKSINHLDTPDKTKYLYLNNGGWHFTFQGDILEIKKKLEAYGHQEYNNDKIKDNLEKMLENNQDFINRGYTLWKSERKLPQYIIKNKDKYKHLLK